MQEGPVRQVIHSLQAEGEQNLKDVRHSFATTPIRIFNTLIRQAEDPKHPWTWLTIFNLCTFLIGNLFLTLASCGVIYTFAIALIAIANLHKTGNRLQWPPPDQVQAIATLLGIIHISVVFTLAVLFGFEPPVSYPVLLASSLCSIGVLFLGVVLGGTVLVACWKMFKGTCDKLYWPNAPQDEPSTEKDELATTDEEASAARALLARRPSADQEHILPDQPQ